MLKPWPLPVLHEGPSRSLKRSPKRQEQHGTCGLRVDRGCDGGRGRRRRSLQAWGPPVAGVSGDRRGGAAEVRNEVPAHVWRGVPVRQRLWPLQQRANIALQNMQISAL
jgi:hypothetical protein